MQKRNSLSDFSSHCDHKMWESDQSIRSRCEMCTERCQKKYHGDNCQVWSKSSKQYLRLILLCRLLVALRSRIHQLTDCPSANNENELIFDRREKIYCISLILKLSSQ